MNDERAKFEVPESVSGFQIDWGRYVPTGGFEWQTYYFETMKPRLQNFVNDAKREVEKCRRNIALTKVLKDGLASVNGFVADMKAVTGGDFFGDASCRFANLIPEVEKEIAESCDRIRADSTGLVGEAEGAVTYFQNVIELFDLDREIDAVLFALYEIPPTYRIKLFRRVDKLCRRVFVLLELIRKYNGAVKELTKDDLERPLEDMFKVYEIMKMTMKNMKRGIDKQGARYWESAEVANIRSTGHTLDGSIAVKYVSNAIPSAKVA